MQNMLQTLRRTPAERETLARELDERLDPIMTALGVIFLLLALSESSVPGNTLLATLYEWTTYVIGGVFVLEFGVRVAVEPDRKKFLRRNWWQIPLLVIPVLRFLRLFRVFRVARAGRVVRSAVRASRSATQALGTRLGWVLTIHVIAVLSAANVLHDLIPGSYAAALHDAAMSATTGEPLVFSSGLVDFIEVVLALYSVVFFAAITGSLGAYYFEKRKERNESHETIGTTPQHLEASR